MKTLIFGDDRDQLEFDAFVLRQAGLQPLVTSSEEKFLGMCTEEAPDLVVLDATSKEIDFLRLVAGVRSDSAVPILLASPQSDEEYVLRALDQGVDDFLAKPFNPRMLAARARTLLRRSQSMPFSAMGPVTVEGLTLDPEAHVLLTPEGASVRLTNMEFRLLYLLMKNPDRVIPTETIVERVWGYGGKGEVTLVKNLVSRVRRKVEPDPAHPRYVTTIPGIGYVFSSSEEADTT
jgi:two-component system KDP operon response regulator KdpE